MRISTKVENYVEKPKDIEDQLDTYLKIMNIEYVDSFSLHTPLVTKIPIEETYYCMQKLLHKGKVRYLGASNFSKNQLTSVCTHFSIKTFEGLYNLECKINEDIGIIDYCKQNNIYFICYQPFRRNRTAQRNYPLLISLAQKYDKTQNQILLNRITKEKKIAAFVKTADIAKAKENIEALNFSLAQEDITALHSFRSIEFDSIAIDRETKDGVYIWKLANQLA